jgi:hypothetical protein
VLTVGAGKQILSVRPMSLLKIGFAVITGLVIAQGLKKVSIGHLYDDLAQILT